MKRRLTNDDWFGDLSTLILPPLPSAPTATKLPLLALDPCIAADDTIDPLPWTRLHHLPKCLLVPSGPSNPPVKQRSPGGLAS